MSSLATSPTGTGLAETRELIRCVEQDARVDAVAVFGSLARREAGPRSDIDVLVVHDGAMPDDLDDSLPQAVTMAFYTPTRLAALPIRSPLFAIHLASEAISFRDQAGVIARALGNVRPLDRQTVSRLAASTVRRFQELIDQPRGLDLNPHAAAAELYALGKQSAMLLCASDGHYEFNRHRALSHAYARAALSATDRRRVDDLEQQWHAARSGDNHSTDPENVEAAAAVVYRLLTALQE
jgi:hypothetical protein